MCYANPIRHRRHFRRVLVLTVSLTIFELRKTPKQEAEMIQREDEAVSKVPDDPHEPARWVP